MHVTRQLFASELGSYDLKQAADNLANVAKFADDLLIRFETDVLERAYALEASFDAVLEQISIHETDAAALPQIIAEAVEVTVQRVADEAVSQVIQGLRENLEDYSQVSSQLYSSLQQSGEKFLADAKHHIEHAVITALEKEVVGSISRAGENLGRAGAQMLLTSQFSATLTGALQPYIGPIIVFRRLVPVIQSTIDLLKGGF